MQIYKSQEMTKETMILSQTNSYFQIQHYSSKSISQQCHNQLDDELPQYTAMSNLQVTKFFFRHYTSELKVDISYLRTVERDSNVLYVYIHRNLETTKKRKKERDSHSSKSCTSTDK